jgi:predicted transcriptional regulator
VRAEQMIDDFPVVRSDTDALDAVRLIAEQRLPGLLVADPSGRPLRILPASQVVRLLVPTYIQDDPSLAGVLSEITADRVAEKLQGKTVEQVLPESAGPMATVEADDTIVEVAAVMARERSPLVAVVADGRLVGVITASRLLEVALDAR